MKIFTILPFHADHHISKVTLDLTSPSQYRQQIPHMFFLRRSLFEFPFEINQASRRPDETH